MVLAPLCVNVIWWVTGVMDRSVNAAIWFWLEQISAAFWGHNNPALPICGGETAYWCHRQKFWETDIPPQSTHRTETSEWEVTGKREGTDGFAWAKHQSPNCFPSVTEQQMKWNSHRIYFSRNNEFIKRISIISMGHPCQNCRTEKAVSAINLESLGNFRQNWSEGRDSFLHLAHKTLHMSSCP